MRDFKSVDGNEISKALYGKGKNYGKKEAIYGLSNHEGPSQAIRPGQESDGNHRHDPSRAIPVLHGEKRQSAFKLILGAFGQLESGGGQAGSVCG